MNIKMLIGGTTGLAIGSLTGWLAFESAIGGIGIGIAIGAAVCGVLIAYDLEES